MEFCHGLGADGVIDYSVQEIWLLRYAIVGLSLILVLIILDPASMYHESHHFLAAGKTFVQVGASRAWGHFVDRLIWPGFTGTGGKKCITSCSSKCRRDLVKIEGNGCRRGCQNSAGYCLRV